MDYKYFTFEEFVADDYFRQWVKQPDESSSLFWHEFIAGHPEQADVVWLAVGAVKKLAEATASLSEPADAAEAAAIWNTINAHLLATGDHSKSPFLAYHRQTRLYRLLAAASVVAAVVGLGWWAQSVYWRSEARMTTQAVAVQALPATIERRNTADKPLLVSLPDGSSIILKKGSLLQYPRQFSGRKRIVYLTGEAFFEVAKDPARPFFVYTRGLITKVLGTSFNVKAYTADENVVVTVRSGRVAIFTQSDERRPEKVSSPTLDGLVLTRNQQLVFVRQQLRLPTPKEISPALARRIFTVSPASFRFDATPVSEVFALLEKVYGITVVYDKKTLGQCRLTADLTDEPLADKMMIICKSIEATYTITDTQLTISSGQGCGP